MYPQIILLISGKRKCGKDYISERLLEKLGSETAAIVRISAPIKSHYAKAHNLDYSQLLSANEYKEKYRIAMINWSDGIRAKEPGFFCDAACKEAEVKKIWIVSDIRRKTDIQWFRSKYQDKVKTIRIEADENVRRDRGWAFTQGVDDVQSECDLDDVTEWTVKLNNNSEEDFSKAFEGILNLI